MGLANFKIWEHDTRGSGKCGKRCRSGDGGFRSNEGKKMGGKKG